MDDFPDNNAADAMRERVSGVLRELLGTRQKQLLAQARTGYKLGTLKDWGSGRTTPRTEDFLVLASSLGVDAAALLGIVREPAPEVVRPRQRKGEPEGLGEPDDLVRIPYLDVVVSAGAGRFNDIARALDHQPWPRVMIQQMGNWRRIQCMRASGDSMEPTILDGALVFVERMHEDRVPQRRPKSKRKSEIYVVVVGDDARVKRVDQTATGLRLLISDNPEHPPEVYPAGNVKVVGRVVGWLNQPAER